MSLRVLHFLCQCILMENLPCSSHNVIWEDVKMGIQEMNLLMTYINEAAVVYGEECRYHFFNIKILGLQAQYISRWRRKSGSFYILKKLLDIYLKFFLVAHTLSLRVLIFNNILDLRPTKDVSLRRGVFFHV